MYLGMCAGESGAWFKDVARVIRTSETGGRCNIVCNNIMCIFNNNFIS